MAILLQFDYGKKLGLPLSSSSNPTTHTLRSQEVGLASGLLSQPCVHFFRKSDHRYSELVVNQEIGNSI